MMKKLRYCLPVLMCLAMMAQAKKPGTVTAVKAPQMPLLFAENKGQVTDKAGKARPDILFTATAGEAQVFLNATGIQYQFTRIAYPQGWEKATSTQQAELAKKATQQTHLFSLQLQGANAHPLIRREQKNNFTEHFYTANVPQEGITNVATYGKVVYENIYPHIDWVLYSKDKHLKYDFVVHPGGDPSAIRLKVQDADGVSLTKDGALLMKTSLGEIKENAPQSFVNGKDIPSRFRQYEDGTIGFEVSAVPGATLVIDPSVTWSTYYGGSGVENEEGLCLDATGNIYMAGITYSTTGIATAGAFQTSVIGTLDNFLVKFSSTGTPLWATYYGSSYAPNPSGNAEFGGACTADNSGNIYLWATTPVAPLSSNMTTAGAYQTVQAGGFDAYLVKFNSAGVRQWATYYGGSDNDFSYGCTSDASGNVFVTGVTASTSGIATSGAYQTTYSGGASDLFVAKFNSAGALQWGTYFGGTGSEGQGAYVANVFHNCATDNLGNLFVGGATQSTSGIASTGAQQTTPNSADEAFLVKFSPTGARIWSTYFGGNDQDATSGVSVATDASGNVYFSGDTYSTTGIATPGAYQATYIGNGDNFLAKYNAAGVLQWATYQGGSQYDYSSCVSVNAAGNVYITSSTYSNNTLGSPAFQVNNAGGSEGLINRFSSAGTLQWASYFGGPGTDVLLANVNIGQDLIIMGRTLSTTGIATTGAYKTTLTGTAYDAFLARISDVPICTPDSITVTQTICGNQLPYTWYGHTVTAGGNNVATDTLTNTAGCDSVLHLNLIVHPVTNYTVHDTICRNDFPITWNGITVNAPAGNMATATYTVSGGNSFGCDSITTLNLFVHDTSFVIVTKTYCRNDLPTTWNGFTIPVTANSNPSYATYYTNNMWSCDSTVRLNLVIHDTFAIAVYDTVCRNDLPMIWNGVTIPNPPGNTTTVVYNGQSVYTCDSVVTLHLYVRDTVAHTVYDTVCANDMPITWNGINVTAGGPNAASFTVMGSNTCDSTTILNLTVHNISTYTQTVGICNNQLPYTWNSIIVTSGGPAAATYTTNNALNCDSVVTLNLVVSDTVVHTEHDTICANMLPYIWNGITVTAGGPNAAQIADTNVAGCDSISILNLVVLPTVAPTVTISVTPGNPVMLGTPVTYTATITNGGSPQWRKNGVDIPGATSSSYTDGNVDSGDVITCRVVGTAICPYPDTVISDPLIMSVITPPPPCLVPVTLISTDIQFTSAVFKWARVTGAQGYEIALDMQPSDPSTGLFTTDTIYHASALTPGVHYLHIRTRCANGDYSPWIKIQITILNPTGVVDPKDERNVLSLYPNPNNGIFNIMGTVPENEAHVDIVDRSGRVVYQAEAKTPGGKLNHRVQLKDRLAQGLYLLRVSSGNEITVIRFAYDQ